MPLVLDLSARHGDETEAARWTDLSRRERVAAMDGLRMNAAKIIRDRAERRRLSAESLQLRVMQITGRAPSEHRLRQEPFSPQGDEPAGVEILGVHGPETQVSSPFVIHRTQPSARANALARFRKLAHDVQLSRATTCTPIE